MFYQGWKGGLKLGPPEASIQSLTFFESPVLWARAPSRMQYWFECFQLTLESEGDQLTSPPNGDRQGHIEPSFYTSLSNFLQ